MLLVNPTRRYDVDGMRSPDTFQRVSTTVDCCLQLIVQTGPEPIATQGNLDVWLDLRAFQEWSVPGEIRGHGKAEHVALTNVERSAAQQVPCRFVPTIVPGRPKVPRWAGIRPEECASQNSTGPAVCFGWLNSSACHAVKQFVTSQNLTVVAIAYLQTRCLAASLMFGLCLCFA